MISSVVVIWICIFKSQSLLYFLEQNTSKKNKMTHLLPLVSKKYKTLQGICSFTTIWKYLFYTRFFFYLEEYVGCLSISSLTLWNECNIKCFSSSTHAYDFKLSKNTTSFWIIFFYFLSYITYTYILDIIFYNAYPFQNKLISLGQKSFFS